MGTKEMEGKLGVADLDMDSNRGELSMTGILKGIDRMVGVTGQAFSFLIYIGMAILVFEVVSRYFFNSPTIWAHGYTQRIFGSYFILIGAYTLLKGGHVRVDLVYSRFSPRVRAGFDVINYGFLLLWCYVLLTEGWSFFRDSFTLREVDEMALAHPVYPVKLLIIVGALLMTLQGVRLFVTSLITLLKGE